MKLKYMDVNDKEVIVDNIKAVRKGFTLFEYQLQNNEVVEVEGIERFWLGVNDMTECVKCHKMFCCMANLLVHRKECWNSITEFGDTK